MLPTVGLLSLNIHILPVIFDCKNYGWAMPHFIFHPAFIAVFIVTLEWRQVIKVSLIKGMNIPWRLAGFFICLVECCDLFAVMNQCRPPHFENTL